MLTIKMYNCHLNGMNSAQVKSRLRFGIINVAVEIISPMSANRMLRLLRVSKSL